MLLLITGNSSILNAQVAKIGETSYDNFASALSAAGGMTGDVTVEILGQVEFVDGMELDGNYSSISFTKGSDDAKMTINQTAGGDYLGAHGKTVSFNGLTLAKANPAWFGNSGHMGNYFSIQGGTVTYTNCIFPNGACTNTGTGIYNNCTFKNSSEYGLWVYDDAIVTVNGGTVDSKKGIKVYSEGEESVTSTLTVQNATFTANVTAKPAVAIAYAQSITLIGNTYNNTEGHVELDSGSDADCEGITFVAKDAEGKDISSKIKAVDRSNSNASCGVLVDGKIYTTVTEAAKEVESGETITLLYNSTETVELPEGVLLDTNGYTAPNVTGGITPITDFASLKTALQQAGSYALMNNITVTEQIEIPVRTKITFDLNGYTITASGGIYPINNNGDLTINDSKNCGVVEGLGLRTGYDSRNTRAASAKLTINGGTFKNVNPDEGAALYVYQGHVYINAGKFYGQNIAISNTEGGYIYINYEDDVNVNDVEIDGYNRAIITKSTVEISNATVKGVCEILNGGEIYASDPTNVTFYEARIGEAANYTSYRTLAEAVQAAESGDVVQIIKEGSYDLPEFREKTLTFEGVTLDKTKTSIKDYVNKDSQGMTGSTVNFKNLTINGANENYYGLFHTAGVTYENCDIYGLRFLYSPTTFTNCAFNADGVEHSFWTYGASNVTVKNSTFTYTDRAVNCYSENGANHELDITFSDCDFVYAGLSDEPAGAVEINSSSVKSMDVAFTNDCTAPEKGEMWYISEWDADGGDNTIVKVNGETVFEVLPVAKIGDVDYKKLQKAVDAAQNGDVITLLRDCGENVTITQKADVKFTIDGAQKTMTGAITVDGKSATIMSAGVTIKKVKFNANNITTDAAINLGVKGDNNTRYTCNVTVENCTFTGTGQAKVAVKSYTGGDKNLTITNCTVDATMHSLAQLINVDGVVIDNCTVNSKNGINLNSSANVVVKNSKFEVGGYPVRIGVDGGTSGKVELTNNTLKTDNSEGDAAIVIRGTASTQVELTMTKNIVSGTTHISGTTEATNISADANYWGEGLTGPVVAEGSAPVVVNSYYTDEALTNLVRIHMGNDFTAYTSEDAIWGEVWGNATESFVIKVLDANGIVMGTTSLNNIGGIIDGDVNVTWSLKLDVSNTDQYWTMEWTTAPNINKMPAKVELWVDGDKVSGGDVVLNAPDNLSKIYAANIDADGNILAYRQSLADAVNNGDNIAILVAGTYNVPTGKNLTITGAVENVKFDMSEAVGIHSSMTFNNVTFEYGNANYKGLQHAGTMVYNDCTINGQVFLYGTSEEFNKCTFNQTSSDAYNVWTYGAKEVAFNECTFNSAGKSVLVYNEGACATDLTVTDTKFIATATVDDKAAIEIDCSLMPKGTSIVIEGVDEGKTTATGFGENTKSGSSLWNDKKVVEDAPNGGTSSEVIIDDVVVKEPALMNLAGGGTKENPYLISTLEDLIWFRYQVNAGVNYYQGKYIALAADIDLIGENWVGIGTATADHGFMGNFDGNGYKIKNLTITNPALDSDGYAYAGLFGVTEGTETAQNTIKNLTIENVTISTTGHIVSAAIAYPYYTIVDNVKVCGNINITGGDYTSGVLAYTRRCVNASNITVEGGENSYITGANVVGGVISDIQMNGGLTANYSNFEVSGVTITGTNMVGGISGIISSQTLNGCSVKNVTLSCEDNNRIGIVSGSLGGVSTVSNVDYENVTGATAIIGATYDGGKAVEAKIGDTYYATLQTAIDAAKAGDNTIQLLADITGNVTILQQEGINIVIDGKKAENENYTFNGTINIYGDARILGEETLTIQNINFYTEDNARYFIHAYDNGQIEGTNNHKQYAHNVTVENCKFATSAVNKPNTIVGMRFRQANDMSAVNCTSDGIFSIMWTTAVDGLTLNGVEATNCTEGITIGGASEKVKITGSTKIESETYAIRAEGAGSDFIIENSTLVAKVPVVVRNVTENSMISFTFDGTNTITKDNPAGYWFVAGKTEYKGGENEQLPETAGQVSVTLNDTGLRYEDVYGNYYELAGEGTADNPYTIANLYELKFFRNAVNAGNTYQGKYVKLTGDIDLAEGQNRSTVSNWEPISTFNGTFDGANHTISNLVINGDGNSNQGFFGQTNNGEIKNVTFENAKVSGRLNVGVVAGTPYTSKYTNIKVTGHVEVNGMAYVGGVGGKNAYANWTGITVDVDGESYVKATSTENGTQYRTYVGGVIGFNGEGGHTFKDISSNINVIGDVCDIGGIFGIAHYGNKFENITHTGTVTNTNSNAEDVVETGLIAGVWHNQTGTSVTFTNTTSDGTISVPNVTGVTFPNDGLIGAAYTTSNETSSTSGSLTINGEQVYPYVAKIGEVGYNTLAKAITAAQNKDVVTLLWVEGDAPIAMNASLYGKNVTIKGTATVDWSKGWLFVGRGGAGDATLTFDNAKLTSNEESLANGTYGIHVSAKEGNDVNKNYGKVIFKNSDVQLSYLANRNDVEVDGGKLYVHYGFWVGGRPSTETHDGSEGTATMDIKNGAVVEVNNHNGMGIGHEGNGVMNITSSTFKYTGTSFNLAKEENSSINVYGESTIEITTLEGGSSIDLMDGAIVKNSTIGGDVFVAGNVTFRGDNTFAMLYDYGTLTGYYGTTANMEWTVEEGASLTLTKMARYGLGYGDNVTINGSITNALEARENLTEDDRSLFMHGLVAQESSGYNCNSKLTVNNAYVVLGSNNSFGNKPGEYGGNYTINFKNSVVDASRITFYEALSTTTFTFEGSDVEMGTFMTRDADSKFTLKNSKVLSTATSNGTDEGNYNAGELTLDKSSLTYSAAFTNTGTLNLDLSSMLTAPSVTGNGIININATDFDGNEICVISANMASFEGVINVVGAHYMKKADGIYVTGAQGTLTKAYTSATGYWGECGGNANESFVLRFYNDNTYMGQTSLNDIDNIIDGDVYVTWSIDLNIDPNAEGYWAMSWGIRPTLAMQPNRVEQWVDGEKVAECAVEPNWADNIFPVVAAVTGEDDVILSYVNNTTGATLKDAFAAGGNIAILRDFNLTESVTVPSGKTVVLNLNGKTMSQTKACTASYEMINNKGNLTIKGNGKISFKDTSAGDPNFGWGSYTVRNEGTLVVENGTIEHLGEQNQPSNVVHMYCAIFQYSGSSTINDGTISTPTYRSARLWKGNMTINGGTFEGQVWVQCVDDDDIVELTINGGSFSPKGGDASSVFVENTNRDAKFTVTGGTFETKIGCSDTNNLKGDRIIGGLFSQSAVDNTNETLLGEGFAFNGTQNAEGYYTVIQIAGTQTCEFANPGWYWFSTYIQFENEEVALDQLQTALGGNASMIKGQHGFTNYSTYNGTGYWSSVASALTTLSTAEMYMIRTTAQSEVELTGSFVDYQNRDITLREGWNWIGYPVSQEMSLSDAIPAGALKDGDQIKSQFDGYATYYNRTLSNGTPLVGWSGQLTQLKPGYGYMFNSASERTFNYTTDGNGAKSTLNTIDYNGENHWFADATQYPNNMTVTAMLSIDGEIVKDNYEVAAFANGECRGSARPIYIEALDAYMLFMTIQGEDVENLTFKYYDVNYGTEYELNNTMVYSNDAIVGTIEEPYMFNLGILNIDETSVDQISIYPNPTTTGKEINLQAMCDKVEVFNALGVKVAEYTNVDSIDAIETAGIYVIRVTIDGNARNCRLIVR